MLRLAFRKSNHSPVDREKFFEPRRLPDLIAPDGILIQPDHLVINGKYVRTLVVSDWPAEVQGGWLNSLYSFPSDLRIATFIFPRDRAAAVKELTWNMKLLEADILRDQKRNKVPDPELEVKLEDAEKLRDALARGEVKIFDHHMFITLSAGSLEELNYLTEAVEAEIAGRLGQARRMFLEEEKAFRTTLPVGRLMVPRGRDFDTPSLAACFPFVSDELIHPDGVVFGINRQNRSIVLIDRFSFQAGHMLVIAATGSGKSYETKHVLTQEIWRGCGAILIDPSPDQEYRRWCEAMGGKYVRLGVGQDVINPLDIPLPKDPGKPGEDELNPVTQKVEFLKNLIRLMAGGELKPELAARLDRVLYGVYAGKGLSDNWETNYLPREGMFSVYRLKEPPVLADVLGALGDREDTKELAESLYPWVEGSLRVFNGRTTIDLDHDLIVFDISRLVTGTAGDDLKSVTYFILIEYILRQLRRSRKKRVLNIDECHYLFKDLQMSRFVESLLRTARRFNVSVSLITQRLGDFTGEGAGVALANAPLVLLMKQLNENELEHCRQVFRLSDAEVMALRNAQRGEGILVAGSRRVHLEVKVPEGLHRLITTNPAEL